MKQFRKGVFETNSSSTHSFTHFKNYPLQQNYMEIDDEGYINLPLIGFCSCETYDQQQEKLAYAVQLAACKSGLYLNFSWNDPCMAEQLEQLYEADLFLNIQDEVIAYIGSECKGIRIREGEAYGYIDDSSDYVDMNEFYDECGGLINFVFSDSYLHYEYNG